jgi:MMPL family
MAAAATIMICVFVTFSVTGQRDIAELGIGLAAAVALDAFILRTVLVPAAMHIFRTANWWLPRWLDLGCGQGCSSASCSGCSRRGTPGSAWSPQASDSARWAVRSSDLPRTPPPAAAGISAPFAPCRLPATT